MNLAELKNNSLSFVEAVKIPVFLGELKTEDTYHKAVVNQNKPSEVYSFVSNGYKVVQHKDVIRGVVEALTLLNIQCEAEVVMCDSRLIVDIEFKNQNIKLENLHEEFTTGIRLINSYDKTTGVFICPKLVRLACTNEMVMTKFIKGYYAIHTANNATEFAVIIKTLITDLAEKQEKFKLLISEALTDSIEWQYCEKLLEKLVGREKHRKALIEILKRDNDISKPITRWSLYNSVTYLVSHGEFLSTAVNEWLNERAEKVLMTPLIQLR